MKRTAIVQSSYIPWKGYFSLIHMVDEFILYDDVQYTQRDWRNRNRIKTRDGASWLTVPVQIKGKSRQRVRDTHVSSADWSARHWRRIHQSYAHATAFAEVGPWVQGLYEELAAETSLSAINARFTRSIAARLGITTPITCSMDYKVIEGRNERLIHLCRQVGAGEYLTGPAASTYLDEAMFKAAGIRVLWMNYGGYPEYPQVFSPPFLHEVTVLDLLFNLGEEGARRYMEGFRQGALRRAPFLAMEAE